MPTKHRNSPSALFPASLFALMVGVIAATVLLVMYDDWSWIGALGIAALIASVVFVVLLVMLRAPNPPAAESADAFEPLNDTRSAPPASAEGAAVGRHLGEGTTTAAAVTSAGTASAPSVAVPADAARRSPLDPAEMPLPGAGDVGPPAGGSSEGAVDALAERGKAIETAESAPLAPEVPRKGALDGGTVASEGVPHDEKPQAKKVPPAATAHHAEEAGGGDPGGVDPMMPAPTKPDPAARDDARAAFEAEAGGGDPGGVDPMMPAPGAGAAADRADARAAFGAEAGGGDPGGADPMMPAVDAAPAGESREDARAAFAGEMATGRAPGAIEGARAGGADDLKMIKGVGPKLEAMLNGMGIYHFDQIAAWGSDEIAWADANIEGFKGRVSRDDWVGQSRTLAAGSDPAA
ncbi:putative flap endonuclease-1-like 5' DNA nuclease [Hasllibacter halocynthiae]|uniref:Putative flap endonuclease-1-like 5' DNA nuclease n=1 Tax=Hasllibacter halocynthiae TaxID=595589 RepID=A0A2T0X7X6_9RHOB|nr:hypothetical protein [Hasllibacter halocynthiae]PRY95027.1 putative flap endonuclease-1-like 5' DNA nuclease [Hasllibacter halocynthiae]